MCSVERDHEKFRRVLNTVIRSLLLVLMDGLRLMRMLSNLNRNVGHFQTMTITLQYIFLSKCSLNKNLDESVLLLLQCMMIEKKSFIITRKFTVKP